MAAPRKKSPAAVYVPRARNAHSRQRQRLIDACISALHIYGPSRTTVEKVVAIAKMSPGIVRFYFASKAAMLVASLQFLSTEFEEQVLVPVMRLKSRPVAALELMVDLYLDPDIASPRKVSVWYAFWGEASSRQEYYDICGQKDESFAVLVRELIERLIIETSQPQLDPDGVALGLIGVLEMLWQDFAFQTENAIDRPAAKRRCMAYLRSVFPGQFGSSSEIKPAANGGRLAGWVYDNARLFALERESLFPDSWQLVGHEAQIPAAGDFLAVDLGVERALIVRGLAGELRAFRNSCTEAPHILCAAPRGHVSVIQCSVHGLQFELNGRRRTSRGAADLTALDMRLVEALILVRSAQRRQGGVPLADSWDGFTPPPGLRPLGITDRLIAADWKLVVEQWFDSPSMTGGQDLPSHGWSARSYQRLLGSASGSRRQQRCFTPNTLVELRADGMTILQALPVGPGRCLLRQYHYTRCQDDRAARAALYLSSRMSHYGRASGVAMVESTQAGIVNFGHPTADGSVSAPGLAELRRHWVTLVPAMGQIRPPTDS